MKTKQYAVRYESDGEVTKIQFWMSLDASNIEIIVYASGLLFLRDFCPGEFFGVYCDDKRKGFIKAPSIHHYYGDYDSLWDDLEQSITVKKTMG